MAKQIHISRQHQWRAENFDAMRSRDNFMRALWIIVNRTPVGVYISEAEFVAASHDVTLRSSENPITHGILIEAIERDS